MNSKIGILGHGNVGSALERGLKGNAGETRAAGHDTHDIQDTSRWADVVILAVPFGAIDDVVKAAGSTLDGKIVVDATNALNQNRELAVGLTTSGAEELQKKLPKAKVVKAFNTVFAKHMDTGQVDGETLSTFIAGDDVTAKATVIEMAREIGFDPVDAGPLKNARFLEPLALLNIQLGYAQKMGTEIGFKLIHAA